MTKKLLSLGTLWTCCSLVGLASSHAQTVYEADFDDTFPTFGYSYAFAGYGDASCSVNTDASDQVSSTFDVTTPPAATSTFDTSSWFIPSDACYDYAGWGLGVGFDLPEGMRPTSGDVSQYTVSFDVSVSGYDEFDDGLPADFAVIFQIPDNNGDGSAEEYRLGVTADDLGNLVERPLLTDAPQNVSVNLADLALLDGQYDFTTEFAETTAVLLQVQANSNAAELDFDADNVLTMDNVRIEGPFAAGGGGDFDGDGDVDGADFVIWQRGESPGGLGSGDLDQWMASFGQAAAVSAVPEPGSLALAFAALGLAANEKRRRRRD